MLERDSDAGRLGGWVGGGFVCSVPAVCASDGSTSVCVCTISTPVLLTLQPMSLSCDQPTGGFDLLCSGYWVGM